MPTGSASMFRLFDQARTTPEMTADAARDLIAGRSPQMVARETGMSVRTAYRWRAELVAIESVRVGGWVATYAHRRRLPPVRISPWECG